MVTALKPKLTAFSHISFTVWLKLRSVGAYPSRAKDAAQLANPCIPTINYNRSSHDFRQLNGFRGLSVLKRLIKSKTRFLKVKRATRLNHTAVHDKKPPHEFILFSFDG